MTLFNYIVCFTMTLLVTFLASGLLKHLLKKRGILDTPNERSSHKFPTPKGGGLAIIPIILLAWAFFLDWNIGNYLWLFVSTFLLGCISWLDDLRGLSVITRLAFQFLAVFLVLYSAHDNSPYFHNLFPYWLDQVCAAVLWIWFVNLFNFMDGIDGIASIESSSIGLGVFSLFLFGFSNTDQGVLGLIIMSASLGFIWWNWQPAKLFLGDVGSIPMGFLLGWLLLKTLASPFWPAAIILPLYYLADASTTLVFRMRQRKKLWRAHREHFYQKATRLGYSHSQVSLIIAGTNILLIILAIISVYYTWFALVLAIICVTCLLFKFQGSKKEDVS